jgi:cellulose synthase/poly-beta-1,6-N-acetylglucosamine synthase-like glycosyltransferase
MNFGVLNLTSLKAFSLIMWPLEALDAVLAGLALLLLIEILAAMRSPSATAPLAGKRSQLAVLVPAHNEEADIARTVETLRLQLCPNDRLIVIADNCSDRTAEVARQAGAFVLERENLRLRGKGYALDYGLQFLADFPPEIVMIVDGDCEVALGSLDALAHQVQLSQRPVQSTYLMKLPPNATLRDQISGFALTLKNLVRPLGMKALGWPSLLTGSGMAFPWLLLQTVNLAGNKTVDDMQLTIDFALQGTAPIYVPESRVTGRLMQASHAASQRSRWEHGHIEVILTQVPRLLWTALAKRRWDLLILGLDLMIPPLSLLILLWISLVGIHLGAYFGGLVTGNMILLPIGAGLPIMLSIAIGWLKFGQNLLPLKAWTGLPHYLLWKIPIYAKFMTQPQTRWIKTERDAADPSDRH